MLTGDATGLVGAAQCEWRNDLGTLLNNGVDCAATITPLFDTVLTVIVTDDSTGSTVSTGTSVSVTPGTCSDSVLNGAETDQDCGGVVTPGWGNELFIENMVVIGTFFYVEVAVAVGTDTISFMVAAYGLNGGVYEELGPGMFAGTAIPPNCNGPTVDNGVAVATCFAVPASPPNDVALAVRTDTGAFVDFVVMRGSAVAPASGGIADGLSPRAIISVPEFNRTPMTPTNAPYDTACLVGTGERPSEFTWDTTCDPSISHFIAGNNSGVNPGQMITGFFAGCPACAAGQACLENLDCDTGLECISDVCAVP